MERAPSQADSAPARPNGRPARVCPDFHHAVELIGKRWAGAIIWALSERPHFFAELSQTVPGLSDRLLSRRLRELEAEDMVKRSVHAGTPATGLLRADGEGNGPAPGDPGAQLLGAAVARD